MKKVLILGASGLVGKAIIEECKNKFDLYGTYCSSSTTLPSDKQFQLNIEEIEKGKELIQAINPDIVISCLRGDFQQQLKFHQQVAEQLQNSNTLFYYFSTLNVFDGDYSKYHSETDVPIAESDYGNFKINCENTLTELLGDRVGIIRIPQMWGKHSPRLNNIKHSIANNETIEVYSNLQLNNLLDTQLAKQMRFIMENEKTGIFHFGSKDKMTHGEFIKKLASSLTTSKIQIQENLYEDNENIYYFGLTSNQDDIPANLNYTNAEIIANLVN